MAGRKGVGPSWRYTRSVSSASNTNTKSGRPTRSESFTMSPYRSCSRPDTRARSDTWYWPTTGNILHVLPISGSGMGPGTWS